MYFCEPCPALAMKSRVSSLLTQFHTSQRCGSVEQSDKVRILSHFSPSHEPLVIFPKNLPTATHAKVRILSHFPPSHKPLDILYLVPHFSQSDKVRIISHFSHSHEPFVILYQSYTSQKCRSVDQSDKVRIMSHFSRSHEPFVILYLVLHCSEVKCGICCSEATVMFFTSKSNVSLTDRGYLNTETKNLQAMK